jgi:hypothetical protein
MALVVGGLDVNDDDDSRPKCVRVVAREPIVGETGSAQRLRINF